MVGMNNVNAQVCPHCGATLRENARFCSRCGQPVVVQEEKQFCAQCGTELAGDAMFCHICGTVTPVAKAPPTEEVVAEKTVTEEAVTEEVVAEEAVTEEAVTEEAVTEEVVAEEAVTEEVITEETITEETVTEETVTEETVTEETVTEETVTEEAVTEKTVTEETVIKEPPQKPMTLEELAMEGPLVGKLPEAVDEEIEEEKPRSVISKIVMVVTGIVAVLAIAFMVYYVNWIYVGDLKNMPISKVESQYGRIEIKKSYVYHDTIKEDLVIKQNLGPNKLVSTDKVLKVVVSKGPGVKIPDLKNQPYLEAKKNLEDQGLIVELEFDYSSTIPKDCIIGTTGGKHVDVGTTITMQVSKGPDLRINVPNLIGKTQAAAVTELQKRGIRVQVTYVYERCDAYGNEAIVIKQSVSGKQEPGTVVVLSVTKPSIQITRVHREFNYVGGVDVQLTFKNTSDKQIKYIEFTTRFQNSFGDDVQCTIRDTSVMNLQYTGPLNPGRSTQELWDAVIYNYNVMRISFDEITVTFTDNTTHTMDYDGYWYWK